MKIVEAVKRAIEEDAQECWSAYVRGGCAHYLHVSGRCAPDGFDAEIMRRLARGLESTRAGMTHVERDDGSPRPWLLIHEERRIDTQQQFIVGGRRITDPQEEIA